ncbi:hypothetical protein [Acidilobus sp.]|uniref:hypothetical protein n=1 Tax=Acidilobus sp. TaxID=1872109 RepID=UPI003CFEBC2B
MGRRLSGVWWFRGDPIYRRIYRVLRVGRRLPSARSITVLDYDEGKEAAERRRAAGFAVPSKGEVWFDDEPPSYLVFAHELIHLARKARDDVGEEMYANALQRLVVTLAARGIVPRRSPLSLLEDVTPGQLLEALSAAFGRRFRSFNDFYVSVHGFEPAFLLDRDLRPVSRVGREAMKLLIMYLSDESEFNMKVLRALLSLLS